MEKINQLRGEADDITSHPTTGISNPGRKEGQHGHQAPSPGQPDPTIHEAPAPADPPVTFTEAVGHSPHDLLRELEAHTLSVHLSEQQRSEPQHHLAELALSSALVWWWTHWQPIMMHRALKTGASLAEVAAAAGISEAEVYERWEDWAEVQSRSRIGDQPALDPAEAETVREHIRRTAAEFAHHDAG